jgi:PhoPQ-activated pathogenicity-related protein
MHKTASLLFGLFILLTLSPAFAAENCEPEQLALHPEEVLACYLKEPENVKQPWRLENKDYDSERKVSIETYTLTSQMWPKPEKSQASLLWEHTLIIYRPDQVKTEQALLYVDGGTRHGQESANKKHFHFIDFKRIAAETQSVVIDLRDIPNQFLTFEDGIPRTEDGLVAYSWNQYLDQPAKHFYWPVHLPMTKAIIKAMDASQQILAENHQLKISHFVVAGASKRGWATWLAALSDERINAMVPIVIDILNTKKNIVHIYESYNNNWPIAFHDYVEQKIPERLNTPAFASLMQIEDPLAYLDCSHCAAYKKRLALPKYIISASGDDFFVPDSLNLYLNHLPGETQVRVAPNQRHYIDQQLVENDLLSYYRTIVYQESRPHLSWSSNALGELERVSTSAKPSSVLLWEAENPNKRDFRLAESISYSAKALKGQCTANNHCTYVVTSKIPAKGWKASFVEVRFQRAHGDPLILTTSTYITGH